ncbi:putative replication protein O [Cylindrospermopsis phage Cr-LKS3]|nr:putative replication protein O [Cylindrospermopsis phage Cr-LKS3]
MILRPRNWKSFQHYKDRSPPWIKLHRDLLNNFDFARLPLASKALAPLLWLLASESEKGEINLSSEALAFRLHVDSKTLADGLKGLIDMGFFELASDVLAERLQPAIPERERETEREAETEARCAPVLSPSAWMQAKGVDETVARDFIALRKSKKAALTLTALEGIEREAAKARMPLGDALRTCCERGWQGFKAEWLADKAPNVTFIARNGVPHSSAPTKPRQML